jgi:predicted ATPase
LAAQEPSEVKLDKLEKALGLATERRNEVVPLIAAMLSIPLRERYPALTLSPAQQRRLTFSALIERMEGLAREKPVLILFEDAHWADATSLEVLDLMIEQARPLPILLLITFRPEFDAPWQSAPGVATVTLGRLDRAQAETLIERVAGGRKLPAEVLQQIVGIAISRSASAKTSAFPRPSIWPSRFGRSAKSTAPAQSPTRRRRESQN